MKKLEQFKKILKLSGVSGRDYAVSLGIGYNSYRTMTAASAKVVPKWVIATVEGWKLSFEDDLLCKGCKVAQSGFGYDMEYCEECSPEK